MVDKETTKQVFDLLVKELNNPKFEELFTPDDLESMYLVYSHMRPLGDKAIIITHMMAEMELKERGILK